MKNNYVPCFQKKQFVVILSYLELHWSDLLL